MNEKDYLKEQQNKFEASAQNDIKEANIVFRDLVKQLLLVATVFLSISGFIFRSGNNIRDLELLCKRFLIFSWLLMVSSIIFGIIQFFIDYFFFNKWAQIKGDIVEKIYTGKISTESGFSDGVIKAQRELSTEAVNIFVWLQVFALILGIILLVAIMIRMLFL